MLIWRIRIKFTQIRQVGMDFSSFWVSFHWKVLEVQPTIKIYNGPQFWMTKIPYLKKDKKRVFGENLGF